LLELDWLKAVKLLGDAITLAPQSAQSPWPLEPYTPRHVTGAHALLWKHRGALAMADTSSSNSSSQSLVCRQVVWDQSSTVTSKGGLSTPDALTSARPDRARVLNKGSERALSQHTCSVPEDSYTSPSTYGSCRAQSVGSRAEWGILGF